MKNLFYELLPDKSVAPVENAKTWSSKFESYESRFLAQDYIGAYLVSTVFLGIDHDYHGQSSGPILFETMIFESKGSLLELLVKRYHTWDQAMYSHHQIVNNLYFEINSPDGEVDWNNVGNIEMD